MFLILLLLTTIVVGTNSSYHPTKVKTVKYPPTHKPVKHPPVHERVKYPPTHKPVKYPPTHKPVKHPPVHESKKHPPVHEPERHPRVETHVKHPPDEKVHIVHTQQHPGNRTGGTHHPESIGNNNTKHTTTQDPNFIRNKTDTHRQQNTGTGGSLYPPSNGLSGNDPKQTTTQYNTNNVHKTEIHHHHYSPPQQIGYGSGSYPVYHAPPPFYVYEYRNSRSRFANLLTGLALYNLGRMSRNNDANRRYVGSHGEVCKLVIVKRNGDYEEAGIDCQLMTSFIWESSSGSNHITDGEQTSSVMTKVAQTNSSAGNSFVTTVTTTNTTLVDAREVKGESIQVTPDMRCYLIRMSRVTAILKKEVECGLLQAYALSSWQNSAGQLAPVLTLLVFQVILFAVM